MRLEQGPESIHVERYKSERPLFVLVLLFSITVWTVLIVSLIGIAYAALLAIIFFISHISFISYVRGNAVRIGPNQFPELYSKINEFSNLLGLSNPPHAYIMQAGGSLNALATKLFRSNFIILYADLLQACGENEKAMEMIIGHEMGHIHAGHLSFHWLLLPGLMMPFLGSAYSRAREYTCDRYGATLCRDKTGALHGLAILSAGAKYGPEINLEAFVAQKQDLNTALMTIGKWLSTHPPLSERIAALDPSLEQEKISLRKGKVLAFALISSLMVIMIFIPVAFMTSIAKFIEQSKLQARMNPQPHTAIKENMNMDAMEAGVKIKSDFKLLIELINEVKLQTGNYPSDDSGVLTAAWKIARGDQEEPLDPFDGKSYGYYLIEGGYVIYSSGPDGVENTDDDIFYSFDENNR